MLPMVKAPPIQATTHLVRTHKGLPVQVVLKNMPASWSMEGQWVEVEGSCTTGTQRWCMDLA